MHVSLMVHANWLKDGRLIHAARLNELLGDQLRLALPGVSIVNVVSRDAHKECLDEPTSVRVTGMPPSGALQDGFSLADQATNAVKAFVPRDDEWAWLPT